MQHMFCVYDVVVCDPVMGDDGKLVSCCILLS